MGDKIIKMQKYVSQPTMDGKYEVAKYCDAKQNYVSMEGEVYLSEEDARRRASELNAESE